MVYTVTYGRRVGVMASKGQDRWDAVRAVKRLHFGVRIINVTPHKNPENTARNFFLDHDEVTGGEPEEEQRFDIPLTAREIETLYTAWEFYRKHPRAPKPKRVKPLSRR